MEGNASHVPLSAISVLMASMWGRYPLSTPPPMAEGALSYEVVYRWRYIL